MVVASTLAFLAVNNKVNQSLPWCKARTKSTAVSYSQLGRVEASPDKPLSKGDLVKMAMENEKRVGVNSGG